MRVPPRRIGRTKPGALRARSELPVTLLALLTGSLVLGGCQTHPTRAARAPRAPRTPAESPVVAVPAAAPRSATTPATDNLQQPAAATPAPTAVPTSASKLAWHGTWSNRWRLRKAGDARDQDFYSVLALNVGDSSRDRVSGHLLGRLSADLDGRGDDATQQVFGSLQDTRGKSVYADLYEASIDVNRPFDTSTRARIGRQYETATPVIAHFDGVRVETDPIGRSKIVAGAYGGIPVRIYEGSSISDQVYGLWAEARPWKDGRVRADWMHANEDTSAKDFSDDLLGLSLWQRYGEHWLFDGGYTWLESENRDVRLRATWNDGQGDFMVQASYYQLLNPQRDFAAEFDPFYSTLQQFEPYKQYRLLASKGLGQHLRADVGGDLRRLDDSGDEGRLNHDYDRVYGTLVVADVFTNGLDLSLTADDWENGQRDIRTWGADLTWTPSDAWRASVGSAYALYKYDVVTDVERDDVRTWYARLRRSFGKKWALDLEYAYDDDNFDNFQQLVAGATWHF